MKTKKELDSMSRGERMRYLEEAEERAERKRLRNYRITDSSEEDKERAIRHALNTIPGGRRYSWLNNAPETVAETLGPQQAIALGIDKGPIAKELQIGRHMGKRTKLNTDFAQFRGQSDIRLTEEEWKQITQDAGIVSEEKDDTEVTAPTVRTYEKILPTPRKHIPVYKQSKPRSSPNGRRKKADDPNDVPAKRRQRKARLRASRAKQPECKELEGKEYEAPAPVTTGMEARAIIEIQDSPISTNSDNSYKGGNQAPMEIEPEANTGLSSSALAAIYDLPLETFEVDLELDMTAF
ncbi:hypothetical protein F5Y15DRAFT_411611 [Xylariaceae sp. FL0016]|nr:hypothetical protein F5Y15DRAFT_411611 [Xylariaceae sp. FL0016]